MHTRLQLGHRLRPFTDLASLAFMSYSARLSLLYVSADDQTLSSRYFEAISNYFLAMYDNIYLYAS